MANIPAGIKDWSTTPASNQPDSGDAATLQADLQQLQATVRGAVGSRASIVSAATIDLGSVNDKVINVTGNTGPVTSFGTLSAGIIKVVTFASTPTLTHHATQLILPGGANIVAAAGDSLIAESLGSGNWKVHSYIKASGAPITMSPITAALGADVALNNTANYFTGPEIAQGSVGVWYVSGTVSLTDSGGTSRFYVKLWDGTTVIASAVADAINATGFTAVTLAGYISAPAGNLRISVKDISRTTGAIAFNTSGESKDSTITAIRIA